MKIIQYYTVFNIIHSCPYRDPLHALAVVEPPPPGPLALVDRRDSDVLEKNVRDRAFRIAEHDARALLRIADVDVPWLFL